MSLRGDAVVRAALAWVGTPYLHQAATKGAGTDCLGLLRGVWREVIGPEPESVPAYTQDWAEPSGDEVLFRAASKWLVRKNILLSEPGDVLLFRMRDRGVAKHLGIQSRVGDYATFVHAYSGHRVVESPLSEPWSRRIVARFIFPEGAD